MFQLVLQFCNKFLLANIFKGYRKTAAIWHKVFKTRSICQNVRRKGKVTLPRFQKKLRATFLLKVKHLPTYLCRGL